MLPRGVGEEEGLREDLAQLSQVDLRQLVVSALEILLWNFILGIRLLEYCLNKLHDIHIFET